MDTAGFTDSNRYGFWDDEVCNNVRILKLEKEIGNEECGLRGNGDLHVTPAVK